MQTAFAQAARLQHDGNVTTLPSSAVSWLAMGQSFGMALVQLDPEGQFQDLVVMNSDTSHHWVQQSTALKSGSPCTDGQTSASGLNFSEPVCSTGTLVKRMGTDALWAYSLTSWYSSHHVYVLGHLSGTATMPPGARQIQINDHFGWLNQAQLQNITAVVVPLPGDETFVFASTDATSDCVTLAEQALPRLETLAPLSS
jgi:hypothetical protein